jgi:hypothetical protein
VDLSSVASSRLISLLLILVLRLILNLYYNYKNESCLYKATSDISSSDWLSCLHSSLLLAHSNVNINYI